MVRFIAGEKPYSLSNFECLPKIPSDALNKYQKLKKELKTLEFDDSQDIYFTSFILDKNKQKVKIIQKEISFIEKLISTSKQEDKTKSIFDLISQTKYVFENFYNLTETTKQALLTYAQVLMNSSETADEEDKFSNIFMAYELCRIGGHEFYFLEMLRSRNRPVLACLKKSYKLSVVYYYAVAFADIRVYEKYGCYYNVAETIVNLLKLVETNIKLKVFLIQKAVFCWSLGTGLYPKILNSFSSFLPIDYEGVVRNTNDFRYKILKSCLKHLKTLFDKPVSYESKEFYLNDICNSIVMVLLNMDNDSKVLQIIRKFKISTGVFIHDHALFKILDKLLDTRSNFKICPDIISDAEVISLNLKFKNYPQIELDKDWFKEAKTVASHQKCANLLRKRLKIENNYNSVPEFYKEYLVLKKKSFKLNEGKLLESCYKYKTELFNALYKVILFKSLDMHFLLDQIFAVTNVIENIEENCNSQKIEEMETAVQRLNSWKTMVQPQSSEGRTKMKKKWNVRWKRRITELKKKTNKTKGVKSNSS